MGPATRRVVAAGGAILAATALWSCSPLAAQELLRFEAVLATVFERAAREWDPIRVDVRALVAGVGVKIEAASLTAEQLAGRRGVVGRLGLQTGDALRTAQCLDYRGMSGLVMNPVPDSLRVERERCAGDEAGDFTLIVGRPRPGEEVGVEVYRVYGAGDSAYYVWDVTVESTGAVTKVDLKLATRS